MEQELRRIRQLLNAILVGIVILIGLVIVAINEINPAINGWRLLLGVWPFIMAAGIYMVMVRLPNKAKAPSHRTAP